MAGQPTARARRAELATFLRTRRGLLHPADVGLPDDDIPGRRRTPGLRREEVAHLSGVSVTWYTWLEQARDISTSPQVLNALARALLLDPDQRQHLLGLAGYGVDPPGAPVEDLPRLRRLVDAASPNIASIYDVHLDYLAWNAAYVRVRNNPEDLPADRRNLLWMMFTDAENRARMVRWEVAARAVLTQFRAAAGQRPDDPRFTELVTALTATSPEFREWWPEYQVRHFKPATIEVDHPDAGRLRLEMFQLRPVDRPDLLMVLQIPATPDDRGRVSALLDGN